MRILEKLSAKKVEKIAEPGRYGDGGGLWLQVTKTDEGVTKSWLFRYERAGKARMMGLGPLHTISLAKARERALAAREKLLDGIDPIDEKRAARAAAKVEAASAMTFKLAAEKFIAAHKAGWRNPKHADQWESTLDTYAYPTIGDLPVAAVDTGLVLKVLEPVWTKKTETAARVRGRIEAVLNWASARGYRNGENPARWRGHLDKLLPARTKVRKVRHMPALAYREISDFTAKVREQEGVAARALEFVVLTACRTGEAIRATWSEIDFETKLWTVPAARTKSGREHRIPLSSRAVEILKALPREENNEHVFIGARPKQPLSQMALLMTLRRMGRTGLTVHGFRSTFRDWAAEQTAYPNEMLEMALAHVVSDKTEAAYRRGDLFEKRRRLMDDWADYCASGKGPASAKSIKNVTPIRRRA